MDAPEELKAIPQYKADNYTTLLLSFSISIQLSYIIAIKHHRQHADLF